MYDLTLLIEHDFGEDHGHLDHRVVVGGEGEEERLRLFVGFQSERHLGVGWG